MKKNILLLFILGIALISEAQVNVTIDTNNVRALVPSTPQLFWDGVSTSKFNVPKTGTLNTVFTTTPWIGGLHNSNLYLAAETYRQNGTDYQSGPISTSYSNLTKWGVIKISKATIDRYIMDHSLWTNPPAEIANWPAHGDTTNGQAFQLAPFVNIGGDPNLYEPQLGDYPDIKGDQCTYYILNDDKPHAESGGLKMQVELHRMVYEYADTNSFLYNTAFVEYTVYNRSIGTFDSTVFSLYNDFDIGYYGDDFIGTDSALNMVYAYNGTDFDAPNGYGNNPPAEGMILLNKTLSSSMFYKNDNSRLGNPASTHDYFNYMNSKWKDDSPLSYGDSGVSGTTRTWYAFSGDACSQLAWTEKNAGSVPGDRRILSNISIPSFPSGSHFTIAGAYLYAKGDSGATSSVCRLKQDAQKLKDWFSVNMGVKEIPVQNDLFSLYPNPANGAFTLYSKDRLLSIEVIDITGKQYYSNSAPTSETRINGLCPGLYFVKATGTNGYSCKKVVVE